MFWRATCPRRTGIFTRGQSRDTQEPLISLFVFQEGWLRKKEEDMLELDHMVLRETVSSALNNKSENALESEVTELQRWAVARDIYKSESYSK